MYRWLSLAVAMLALAASPAIASASQGSVHFGPIDSSSSDSGTCGNDWANDTYKRAFDASTTANVDSTFTVTETFISGRFVTVEGSSPGACNPSVTGGSIASGVKGTFNGYFLVVISGGDFNATATCDVTSCGTTAGFVSTVYGAGATYEVTDFSFQYHANGPGLSAREWQNASADQGGNLGDIASA
jgi:hypothetical protein